VLLPVKKLESKKKELSLQTLNSLFRNKKEEEFAFADSSLFFIIPMNKFR
jgi:hypothetical protein